MAKLVNAYYVRQRLETGVKPEIVKLVNAVKKKMNDLDKLQEARRKYEEHGVDCHQEYIQELEKYTSMWFHLKEYADHNLIKGGYVDTAMKNIEEKHGGE